MCYQVRCPECNDLVEWEDLRAHREECKERRLPKDKLPVKQPLPAVEATT
jgi:hypothetical protein